jgi:hypothetical protein
MKKKLIAIGAFLIIAAVVAFITLKSDTKTTADNCAACQEFVNQEWYPKMVRSLTKENKIDLDGAEWIKMISSDSNIGSPKQIVHRQGNVEVSDIVTIYDQTGIVFVITKQVNGNGLHYIFSYNPKTNELVRARGYMVLSQIEQISEINQEMDENIIITTIGNSNKEKPVKKTFVYNTSDNIVRFVEVCSTQSGTYSCDKINQTDLDS